MCREDSGVLLLSLLRLSAGDRREVTAGTGRCKRRSLPGIARQILFTKICFPRVRFLSGRLGCDEISQTERTPVTNLE